MKTIKWTIPLAVLVAVLAASCKGDSVDITKYMAERDSIMLQNQRQQEELSELNGIITTIASGLDSIAAQEHVLLTNKSHDGVMLDRRQIASNLNYMADILARQRKKIKSLQDSLANRSSSEGVEKMQRVIDFLNQQLAEKDRVIRQLRTEVSNQRTDIARLRTTLGEMQTRTEVAEQKNTVLTKAVATQDEIINECYMKIGTKKQLKAAGLLKGRKLVNYENVSKKGFTAVDIRRTRSVRIKTDDPKILSPMPNSHSFHFENNGDGTCTLNITDPTTFWSVSNFLIIQL